MLVGDKIANDINSLKPNQKYILNVVHTLTKDYVKYNGHNVKTVHILSQAVETHVNLIGESNI